MWRDLHKPELKYATILYTGAEQMHYVNVLNASVRSTDFSANEGEMDAWLATGPLGELHFKVRAEGGEWSPSTAYAHSCLALALTPSWTLPQMPTITFRTSQGGPWALEEMLQVSKRWRNKYLSRGTLLPDLPGTVLIHACRLSALPLRVLLHYQQYPSSDRNYVITLLISHEAMRNRILNLLSALLILWNRFHF